MATLRKFVSDIRSTHKILSTDSTITDRAIASEIRNSSLLLVKRESNLRRLWATDSIFTTIPCLEMKEVPISECGGFVDDCTIARSVHKIPSIAEGNYQYVIQGVYSINALSGKGSKLKEITINRYLNLLKLPIIKNEHYFWISNDYLYVTNPFAEAVRLAAYFEEIVPNTLMFPDCGCGTNYDLEDICRNPLDLELALPGYLQVQVLKLVSETLLKTYFSLQSDITSEGIDGQAPNSTPTN
jgi:hypothetical protein